MTSIVGLGSAVVRLLARSLGPVGHVVVFARPSDIATVAARLEELGHADWSVRTDRTLKPGRCYLVA